MPFIFVLFFWPTNDIQAKESILWTVGNHPPRVMVDGPGSLTGQGGIQHHILETGLKAYIHEHVTMDWFQFETAIKENRNICSSFVFKTSLREKLAHYSLPWHIDLPHRIIMRMDNFKKLGMPRKISLVQLIHDHKLFGAIEKARSFSTLDEIINNASQAHNLEIVAARPTQLMAMLNAGRIDFTVEYPHLAAYMQGMAGHDINNIAFIEIEEAFEYAYTYVACTKNAWGQKVVKEVNDVIRQERSKPSYLKILKMIHPKQKERDKVEEIYYRDFLHHQ